MSEARRPSGLETLVVRILSAESLQDRDREEIAYTVFNGIFGSDYLEATNLIGLEAGVLSFLARATDLKKALMHLIGDRYLAVALANELAGRSDYSHCPRGSDLSSALDKLLDTVELPTIHLPPRFRGRSRQEEFLIQTKRELDDLSDNDKDRFKPLTDSGWGELDTLTKIVVRFHGALFGESGEIAEAFSNASQANGISDRLSRMQHIQKMFRKRTEDDLHYVYKYERAICQWRFGRSTPFGGFLEGDVDVDLSQVPSRWSVKWQDVLASFDNSKSCASGVVPVSVLNYYKTNVQFYRNFYAHANSQEWEHAGSEMVRMSFAEAERIIQRILDLNLCPDMIVPIVVGENGFRRRVAFFVHEKHLKRDGSYARRDIRVMFLGGDQFVQPHRFYFCPHPAESGMFEPFLVPADEII
jgi:hypothetical protein